MALDSSKKIDNYIKKIQSHKDNRIEGCHKRQIVNDAKRLKLYIEETERLQASLPVLPGKKPKESK